MAADRGVGGGCMGLVCSNPLRELSKSGTDVENTQLEPHGPLVPGVAELAVPF